MNCHKGLLCHHIACIQLSWYSMYNTQGDTWNNKKKI